MAISRPDNTNIELPGKIKRKRGRPTVRFPVDRARPPEFATLLSLTQVRELLGVSAQRVYVLADEGKLHAVRMPGGGFNMYLPWEVEALSQRHLYVRVA